ncbi:transposase [Nonomuraea sp. NPDC049028]|uniref:transposase n=1 Tax=Nonomuraea sp. NPDC049028 TaxID=3364348 RepID=UPI0037100347
MVWRFRTGSPWRDVPDRYGSWSTVYNLFRLWVTASTFQALMDEMIAEAAAREQVDLSLVSVDSTVARAQHAGRLRQPPPPCPPPQPSPGRGSARRADARAGRGCAGPRRRPGDRDPHDRPVHLQGDRWVRRSMDDSLTLQQEDTRR